MSDIMYTVLGESYLVRRAGTDTSEVKTLAEKEFQKVSHTVAVHSIDAHNKRLTVSSATMQKEFWVYQSKGKRILAWPGGSLELEAQEYSESAGAGSGKLQALKLTMPGKVLAIKVQVGDSVEPGQGLVIVEAMKMENLLLANAKAKVAKIHVATGDRLESGTILITFEACS